MKCDTSVKNRLKRTQGQMQGVLSMMENESTCVELVTQLKAIRSSVDQVIGILTTQNLVQAIEAKNNLKLDDMHDAINLIIKGI